jgi:UDP-N-acetylglucosamine 4,6-dehydratase
MENKKIFIFGGSGSLGNCLIKRYIDKNTIYNYSRDECKHWKMELCFRNKNLHNIIGDIINYNRVEESLLRYKPDIIIIASAMKHIDRCEFASNESLNSNLLGTKNIVDVIEKHQHVLSNLESVLFVSTDKACNPINIYGMCKALSEKLIIEKSHYVKNIKFMTVRYGNVLNSRGSIIQILDEIGKNPEVPSYKLTNDKMTRFIMTLEDSCDLIEYTLQNGESGDTVIPKIKAILIKDLINLYAEKYKKNVILDKIRPGEKMYESLINDSQSMRLIETEKYYHIKSNYKYELLNENMFDYNSNNAEFMPKEELYTYLQEKHLI